MKGYEELLEGAVAAARAGGEALMRHFGRLEEGQIDEKGRNDFVTRADRAAEEAVLQAIEERFPGAAVLAEESGGAAGSEGLRWVVDPLDGTTNYIHGYPLFGVSVACEEDGTPVAGAVLDPLHDELFQARRGGGARLNDQAIGVSGRRDLSDALIVTGFPFRSQDRLREYLGSFETFLRSVAGVRRDGSAALNLCYVACGRYDGFWELGLSRWDLSAGTVILREAGGEITGFAGAGEDHLESGDVVVGNAGLHEAMLAVVARHF